MTCKANTRWILFIAIVLILLFSMTAPVSAREVKVALYQYEPMIFTDENGNAAGITVDLINDMAKQNDWKLEYIECTWAEALEFLENGEVDVVTNIAYTEERDSVFNFTAEPAHVYWSQVYVNPDLEVNSILDLSGKTIIGNEEDFSLIISKKGWKNIGYNLTILKSLRPSRSWNI